MSWDTVDWKQYTSCVLQFQAHFPGTLGGGSGRALSDCYGFREEAVLELGHTHTSYVWRWCMLHATQFLHTAVLNYA